MKRIIILLSVFSFLLLNQAFALESCRLIVYSAKDFNNAKKAKQEYRKKKFKNVTILKNEKNNMFMVSVAQIEKKYAPKIVKKLKQLKKIPKDSLCSSISYSVVENSSFKQKNNKEQKESKLTKKEIATLYHSTDELLQHLSKLPEQEVSSKYGELIKNLTLSKSQLMNIYHNIEKTGESHLDLTQSKIKKQSQLDVSKQTEKYKKIEDTKIIILAFNKLILDYNQTKKEIINVYNKNNKLLNSILQSETPLKDDVSTYVSTLKSLSSYEKSLIKIYENVDNLYSLKKEAFVLINKTKEMDNFLNVEKNNIQKISQKIQTMRIDRLCDHKRINCK